MSQFLTELHVARLSGQFKEGRALWRLLAPLRYQSDKLGEEIAVPADYVTDFASVPRLPLTYLMAGDTAHEAAVIHDWLYTPHAVNGKPVTRAQADAVFREAIGVSDHKAPGALMWLAVRLGGGGSWSRPGPAQEPRVAEEISAQTLIAP